MTVFQHTAARRRLEMPPVVSQGIGWFQHTAARRRLGRWPTTRCWIWCFNTQPPEGGWMVVEAYQETFKVSTHSRPKAAGAPPANCSVSQLFQHTAARRRLEAVRRWRFCGRWFQHTAARRRLVRMVRSGHRLARFNTQPPEGGWYCADFRNGEMVCFNTQPPEGGWLWSFWSCRLRLVSTHSRPKAAGNSNRGSRIPASSFNTQPPEGGWQVNARLKTFLRSFNTQPPEGGWFGSAIMDALGFSFNTQPPEGGWKNNGNS